jgi:hypothetical protein
MRGIVSLAIALALPYTLGDEPFPARSEMIFFTFCVIFVTLVLQGLTLGPLIEWLGVTETSRSKRRETGLRIRALEAAIVRLRRAEAQTGFCKSTSGGLTCCAEEPSKTNPTRPGRVGSTADSAKKLSPRSSRRSPSYDTPVKFPTKSTTRSNTISISLRCV